MDLEGPRFKDTLIFDANTVGSGATNELINIDSRFLDAYIPPHMNIA